MTIIIAEWTPHMNAYRVFRMNNPNRTIAYVDTEEEIERAAEEYGWEKVYICK
ncbi:MAG: hypothetical protein IKN72_06025 [Clostridia bacterium]|nr:hypothetical protein [Clostridia bacterium]